MPDYKPVSIVMPVLNQLDYTKRCIDSILRNTAEHETFEFIIIDNGSDDGTHEYLKDISSRDERFVMVSNAENVGVCKSWNQGVRLSKHDYICIINNDIEILTVNWLTHMQSVLSADSSVKWTSPQTCYGAERKLKYKKCHFEQLLFEPHSDQYVVGCCFMIPRSAFDEIGMFDEQFEIRYYEDLDYLAQILSSGYKVRMCKHTIIWHARGTTSSITQGGEENAARYDEKWGKTPWNMDFWRGVK